MDAYSNCRVELEIKVFLKYLNNKKFNREELNDVLFCFSENSLNLLVSELNDVNNIYFNDIKEVIKELKESNKKLIMKTYSVTNDEYGNLLMVYNELVNTEYDLWLYALILNSLSKTDITALIQISSFKGNVNLCKKLKDIDIQFNKNLVQLFIEKVEKIYNDKNSIDDNLVDLYNDNIENVYFNDLDFVSDDLADLFDLTECLIILNYLNVLELSENSLIIKILVRVIKVHQDNPEVYVDCLKKSLLYNSKDSIISRSNYSLIYKTESYSKKK